jgi:hypothetical protein
LRERKKKFFLEPSTLNPEPKKKEKKTRKKIREKEKKKKFLEPSTPNLEPKKEKNFSKKLRRKL